MANTTITRTVTVVAALLFPAYCMIATSEAQEMNTALSPRQRGIVPIAAFAASGDMSTLIDWEIPRLCRGISRV